MGLSCNMRDAFLCPRAGCTKPAGVVNVRSEGLGVLSRTNRIGRTMFVGAAKRVGHCSGF